jgi:hypothetical protein
MAMHRPAKPPMAAAGPLAASAAYTEAFHIILFPEGHFGGGA